MKYYNYLFILYNLVLFTIFYVMSLQQIASIVYPHYNAERIDDIASVKRVIEVKPTTEGSNGLDEVILAYLDDYSHLYNTIKCKYIKRMASIAREGNCTPTTPLNKVAWRDICPLLPGSKKSRIMQWREFAGLRTSVKGMVKSKISNSKNYILDTKAKIKLISYQIEKLIEAKASSQLPTEYKIKKQFKNNQFCMYQCKHLLAIKRKRLRKLQNDLNYLRSIDFYSSYCLGGKAMLRKRHWLQQQYEIGKLSDTEYAMQGEAWEKEWDFVRNNQFFLQGVHSEPHGNSMCQVTHIEGNTFSLRITVNATLVAKYGSHLTMQFKMNYHVDEFLGNYSTCPLSYRFVKLPNGSWRIKVGYDLKKVTTISHKRNGMLGLDFNVDHIACGRVDKKGNLKHSFSIPIPLNDATSLQRDAIMSNALKQVVDYAVAHNVPIAIESLDFKAKKRRLKENDDKCYARMLSSFNYSQFQNLLSSKCYRQGIELVQVNPEYTSILGEIKYSDRYFISRHLAAAMVIARRAQGFREKLPKQTLRKKNGIIYTAKSHDVMTYRTIRASKKPIKVKLLNNYRSLFKAYDGVKPQLMSVLDSDIPYGMSEQRLAKLLHQLN